MFVVVLAGCICISGCGGDQANVQAHSSSTTEFASGVDPLLKIQSRAYAAGIQVGPLYNDRTSGTPTMVFVVTVSPTATASTYDQILAKLTELADAYGGTALNAVRLEIRIVSSADPKTILARRYYPLTSAGTS